MRHDRRFADEVMSSPPSPGPAVVIGMGAGLGVILLGTVVGLALGWAESNGGWSVLWLVPPLGAAVAAGTATAMMEASDDRVIGLAFGAFFGLLLINWGVDFLLLRHMLSRPEALVTSSEISRFPMRGYLTLSFFYLVGGTILGMLFGGPSKFRRSRYD